jgi:orotidine-5'-phosphate decarboxylase
MAELTPPVPIVALDVPTADAALALVDRLGESCTFYKVGLELFVAAGPPIVQSLRARGADVFLDLKLHDIPNTVAGAVRSAAALGARLLTVHASGGAAMLAAASEAAQGTGCGILGVTVLTSLEAPESEVLRLAALAADAGLHGVVCSGREAAAVRVRWPDDLATLVPGIRPGGAARHDQARVVTPGQAAEAGATYVVLGRAVTQAAEPREALRAIALELQSPATSGLAHLREGRKPA